MLFAQVGDTVHKSDGKDVAMCLENEMHAVLLLLALL